MTREPEKLRSMITPAARRGFIMFRRNVEGKDGPRLRVGAVDFANLSFGPLLQGGSAGAAINLNLREVTVDESSRSAATGGPCCAVQPG